MTTTGYVVLTGVVVPLAGVGIYWLRGRVELWNRKDAQTMPQQTAEGILLQQLAKTEARLAQEQELNRQDRERHAATLTLMQKALEEMAADLRSLRDEERAGRGKLHEQIGVIDHRLTVIETRLEH